MTSLISKLGRGVLLGGTLLMAHGACAEQITWWAPNWGQARAEALVKQFEATNPNITVKIEITVADGLQNRVVVALRSGSPPDLIDINSSWNVPFAANHQLMDLGDFITKSHTDLADFLPATLAVSKVGDTLYGIPYRAETVGLIYNKAAYKAAGLDPAKPPQTWSELLDFSKQLTRKNANGQQQYGYGLVGGGEVANMVTRAVPYILMNGGSVVSEDGKTALLNQPPAVEAIDVYTSMLTKYGVSPPSTLQNDGLALRRLFLAGTIAQYVSGQYDIAPIRAEAPNFDLGVAVMPHPDGKQTATLLGGWSFIVPQASKHHDSTLTFLQFLIEPAQMGMYTDTFPARKSAFDLPRFQDPILAAFKDALQFAQPAPAIPAWVQIGQILYNNIQQVLLKVMTPQQAMDAATKQIQPLL
jgi:multiple sugar transport system substrate-binding protein